MTITQEHEEMLGVLNIKNKDDLFRDVPEKVRKNSLNIPEGISEFDVLTSAREISLRNQGTDYVNFLGNGIYDRVVPTSVDSLIGRTEFMTSYTPYQAEMSQGVLQSLFEYQSLVSQLTGMDVTNSSMYDGYTALGEAVRMAYRINGKHEVLVPETLYKDKLQVIESYMSGLHFKTVKYRIDPITGFTDLDDLEKKVNENTGAIISEMPNGLGIIDENVPRIRELKKSALLIAYVDPISLGILTPPGTYDADIVVAEGQQLGIHKSYGGPLLGILSFKNEHVRKSPGRIIGESVDVNGKRAFVMTLQTREQHIRRQKAMSNICTNQALMAIAAATYLSVVGASGLKKVAAVTYSSARQLKTGLDSLKNSSDKQLTGQPFSDVLVSFRKDIKDLQGKLFQKGIHGGVPLSGFLPNTDSFPQNAHFFSVTEKITPNDISTLLSALEVIQ